MSPVFVFVFKRKTAYEMRISDWSSDVCSSDLRLACEPVAYITGTRDFWTIALHITPDVLIPRPDSETLIEAAVESLPREGALRFLDLGTVRGALLLAALDQWPESTGGGVDSSAAALAGAAETARRLGLVHRAAFVRVDWAQAVGPEARRVG